MAGLELPKFLGDARSSELSAPNGQDK
jgi:hypothetical protein